MTTLSQKARELAALIDKATPGPWGFRHRYCGEMRPPADGIDAWPDANMAHLGWDWETNGGFRVPPEADRGVFAKGADAAAVAAARNDAPALLHALADENERLRKALEEYACAPELCAKVIGNTLKDGSCVREVSGGCGKIANEALKGPQE